MAFVRIHGLNGRVYVPDGRSEIDKKHPCNDCYACQMCSDDRCNVCRNQDTCLKQDQLNMRLTPETSCAKQDSKR